MEWQTQLISLYLMVCKFWAQGIGCSCERMSHNDAPRFTDEEVVAVYLFGIMEKRTELSQIHKFTKDHLDEWFPGLPEYKGFVYRINRIACAFEKLLIHLLEQLPAECKSNGEKLVDSMPVMLAKAKRSSQARVAPEIANKGYCASKGTYYYGVKLHMVGERRKKQLPVPEGVLLSSASTHDLSVFEELSGYLENCDVYADKAYAARALERRLKTQQNVRLLTPVKCEKGQEKLGLFDQLLSTAVSSIRQPIESFFNWLQEKTGVQVASKVRSYKGLLVHVFGRFTAAAFMLLIF